MIKRVLVLIIVTYSTNKIEAEMALDVSPEIQRQATENSFFVDSVSGDPLVLIVLPHGLPLFRRQLPVAHPLLCIHSLDPPFFQPSCCGLQIRLPVQVNYQSHVYGKFKPIIPSCYA